MPKKRDKIEFSPAFEQYRIQILSLLKIFNNKGHILLDTRNTIKSFNVNGLILNIKSFRPPHLLNKIVYSYFRKSKARRSFENAVILINKGIGTPTPVAYIEEFDKIGLAKSYYISEQIEDIFLMTDVIHNPAMPERNELIKLYTKFHFKLHESGIEFLDNTQGNTLFRKYPDGYQLYLVDLNRMHTNINMDLRKRIKNFSHLTRDVQIMQIIAREYAVLSGKDFEYINNTLQKSSLEFYRKLDRKKRWKKRWKKIKSAKV